MPGDVDAIGISSGVGDVPVHPADSFRRLPDHLVDGGRWSEAEIGRDEGQPGRHERLREEAHCALVVHAPCAAVEVDEHGIGVARCRKDVEALVRMIPIGNICPMGKSLARST